MKVKASSAALPLMEDACARLNHRRRAMFGGHGFFAPNGGIFAAIVDEDRIILKLANAAARSELEDLGGHAWTYAGKMTMREWILVPQDFYDDPDLLQSWSTRAHRLAPARGATAGKKKAGKKKARA